MASEDGLGGSSDAATNQVHASMVCRDIPAWYVPDLLASLGHVLIFVMDSITLYVHGKCYVDVERI